MSTKPKLLLALAVLLIVVGGMGYWIWRGTPAKHTVDELSGADPIIVEPDRETIPSVAIADPIGWAANQTPKAAEGLAVSRFAEGLDHPRTMLTLPNGDVIVALTGAPEGNLGGGLTGWIAKRLMSRAGSGGKSPDTLVLLRDADGDGKAEGKFTLRAGNGLASPSGIAWAADKLYVANHDAVLSFDYKLGETTLAGSPTRLFDLPAAGGHWMRNLLLTPDGEKLYVAVGSATNIADEGPKLEERRAAIHEFTFGERYPRPFAQGLRNPNGLAWNPSSGELWTTVNERDLLGPDLVPDYLTNVPVGAHYGWPWIYWKEHDDHRVNFAPPDYIDDFVRKPEYALGAHTASLGLQFDNGGVRLGTRFANGAFIARHGSWNRQPAAGYDVVFVKFDERGNPQGKPISLLTGFLNEDGDTHGRPTWLTFARDGALLVSDDTAGIIWRVIDPAAQPSVAPRRVTGPSLPPRRQLDGDPSLLGGFKKNDTEVRKQ